MFKLCLLLVKNSYESKLYTRNCNFLFPAVNRVKLQWCFVLLWLQQVIYENKARLLCSADGSPLDLFQKVVTVSEAKNMAPRTSSRSRKNDESDLCVDNELGFAKDRTISRYDIPVMIVSKITNKPCVYLLQLLIM